jgi:hypothetical protein
MYNASVTGAINTGIPAAVVAVSSTGHGGALGGAALVAVATVNVALLLRAARLRSRSFAVPAV